MKLMFHDMGGMTRDEKAKAVYDNAILKKRYVEIERELSQSGISVADFEKAVAESAVPVSYSKNIFTNPDNNSGYNTHKETVGSVEKLSPDVWFGALAEATGTERPGISTIMDESENAIKGYMSNRNPIKYPNLEIIASKLLDNGVPVSAIVKGFTNIWGSTAPERSNPPLTDGVTVNVFDDAFSKKSYGKAVSFYSTKVVKNLNNLINLTKTQYPEIAEEVKNGLVMGERTGNNNAYYNPSAKNITLSLNTLSMPSRSGFSIPSASGGAVDVVTHEFGHALHQTLTNAYKRSPAVASAFDKHGKIFQLNQDSPSSLQAVSTYGNMNKAEAFAEAFTLYTLGGNPTMGKEYFALFNTLMKDLNLEHLRGIYSTTSTTAGASKNSTSTSSTLTMADFIAQQSKAPVTAKPSMPEPITKQKDSIDIVKTFKKTLNGKTVSVQVKPSDVERGYVVKTINGKRYKIDVETQNILR